MYVMHANLLLGMGPHINGRDRQARTYRYAPSWVATRYIFLLARGLAA